MRWNGSLSTLSARVAAFGALLCGCNAQGTSTDGSSSNTDAGVERVSNAQVSGLFAGTLVQFQTGQAVYSHVTGDTTVTAQYTGATAADDQAFTLFFPGDGTGTFACGSDASNVTTGFTYDISTASYSSTGSASLTPCQIAVVAYGQIGGLVTGTFSGTVFANSTIGGAPPQVRISSGMYNVSRFSDQ